jgi:hypothetical protein
MTDKDRDIREAQEEAHQALQRAETRKAVGSRLAEEWRRSRRDNNFRAMVRQLASGGST